MLDVNFCYNTLCSNFGIPDDTTLNEEDRPYKIRVKGNSLSLICKECGLNRRIFSNEAVETLFLRLLKRNLLHEYCPNQKCENYRVNMYEHMYDSGGEKYHTGYGVISENEFRARCVRCGTRFLVGTPWRLHGNKRRGPDKNKTDQNPDYKSRYPAQLQTFMQGVMNNTGPADMINEFDCHPEHYYSHLHSLADTCSAISARQLMKLQSKRFVRGEHYKNNDGCIRLYSDVMDISIFLGGEDKRVALLPCLVTSTDYNDSFFALAFTPMFIPGELSPDKKEELREEVFRYECHQANAHLHWEGVPVSHDATPRSRPGAFNVTGLRGYFINSSYGALAHFLVLRKMLSRFRRVIHYVDNESVMQTAALTGFADKIKARECEVVLVSIVQAMKSVAAKPQRQRNIQEFILANAAANEQDQADDGSADKKLPSGEKLRAARKRRLLSTVPEVETKLKEAAKAYDAKRADMAANRRFPDERAFVYRLAINKMTPKRKVDEDGENENKGPLIVNLWVKDPLSPGFEPGRFFLRSTRRPEDTNKTFLDQEVELYLDAKHQPVDTYMSALRRSASQAERARLIASTRSGAGYLSSPRKPKHAIAEFELHRFSWNFMRLKRGNKDRHITRGHRLGLSLPKPLTVRGAQNIRNKVFVWAREITKWLGT